MRAKMLTPGEVAQLWQCSTETVLRLVGQGALPAVRLTRKTILISDVDAAAFYAERRTNLSGIPCIPAIRTRRGRPWGSTSAHVTV